MDNGTERHVVRSDEISNSLPSNSPHGESTIYDTLYPYLSGKKEKRPAQQSIHPRRCTTRTRLSYKYLTDSMTNNQTCQGTQYRPSTHEASSYTLSLPPARTHAHTRKHIHIQTERQTHARKFHLIAASDQASLEQFPCPALPEYLNHDHGLTFLPVLLTPPFSFLISIFIIKFVAASSALLCSAPFLPM